MYPSFVALYRKLDTLPHARKYSRYEILVNANLTYLVLETIEKSSYYASLVPIETGAFLNSSYSNYPPRESCSFTAVAVVRHNPSVYEEPEKGS